MILEVLGSAGFGSIIGGLFGWLGKRQENDLIKAKQQHELNMVKAKTDATVAIAEINMEQAKQAGELMVAQIAEQSFRESQKPSGALMEGAKAIMRPLITLAMLYQTYMIFSALESLTGGLASLPAQDKSELFKILVLMITGLTATVVSWWFASRGSKQFDKLLERVK